MQLELTDDQRLVVETARRFIASITPSMVVRELAGAAEGFDRETWRRGAQLGWSSLLVAESDGGGSVSANPLADAMLVAEELGRGVHPGPFVALNVVAEAISRRGTDRQKSDLLAGLLDGTLLATWATSEPSGRWDPRSIALEAELDGDEVVLSGRKSFVEDPATADYLLVTARVEGDLSQFLVPTSAPGLAVDVQRSIDLVRRLGEVNFDRVRLPRAAALGPIGQSGPDIEHQLNVAALLSTAEILGAMERVFEMTMDYGMDRISFGRPILSYQVLKHRMADSRSFLEAAHGMTEAAVRAVHAGASDVDQLTSAAKAYAGDLALEVVQDAVQIHGGIGVTWEHDLHLYLRRVTLDRALYGDPAEHRERLVTRIGL